MARAILSVSRRTDFWGQRIAWFSNCERYRYRLDVVWDTSLPTVAFLMLNPSTADQWKNDPTVERCERRARDMGFGSVIIINLFGLRSTNPSGLLSEEDPVGRDNDSFLIWVGYHAQEIICAWGTRPNPKFVAERMNKVVPLLPAEKLRILKLSKDGFPCHPLYLSYDLKPVPWGGNDGKR